MSGKLFYIVIGTHKVKQGTVYDVISSRYERTSFNEEKVKALLEMRIISGGVPYRMEKLWLLRWRRGKQQREGNLQYKEGSNISFIVLYGKEKNMDTDNRTSYADMGKAG